MLQIYVSKKNKYEYISQQLEWILEKALGSIGRFSQLIFINPASGLSDTTLGNMIDNMDLTLKQRYANHIFASKQPAFASSHSQKDHHATTLFVAKEEALTKEEAFMASLINSSNTRTGNSLIITSTRKCDLVEKGIFNFHLRLDSLSFAICSSTGDMKKLIELYKVMIMIILNSSQT